LKKQSELVIAGIFPCLEALQKGASIEKILLKKDLGGPNVDEIKRLAFAASIPVQQVPIEKINRVTRVRHQGVVAFQSFVDYHNLEQIIPTLYEEGKVPLGMILDRITDVRNFGAICRTAECMGCHFIVIPKKNAAQINDEAVKSSAGAISHLPICRESSLKDVVKFLKDFGLSIVGASEKAEKTLFEVDLKGPTAIVMGSEMDGISSGLMSEVDQLCKIPMTGKVQSLNVSVSAGMFLLELTRQRI